MFIDLTDDQRALAAQLREYFAGLLSTSERRVMVTERHGPVYREVVRRMGRDGWLGVGWPTAYGGRGFGSVEQQIFVNEAARADVPLPAVTLQTVGPTLQALGTPEQKEFFLPRILAGELHFSIGYTEPSAGTDLASLRTAAVKDGEEWRINGQKIFTSLASYADYVWLAARTDPEAPKHKGISIFLVPTTDPGFSYTKIHTMVNASTFNTYYDDVRVGDDAIVYGLNRGWDLIINQLNYERVSLAPPGMLSRTYEETVRWAQDTKLGDGRRVIDQEWVQLNLARVRAKLEFLQLIGWKVAASGGANPADASSTKVFGTEFSLEAYKLLSEVLGAAATLRRGSPGALLAGRIERGMQGALILTFGGGVNEVQRDLIALFGLGMPRVPRH